MKKFLEHTTRTKTTLCPVCGYQIDAATAFDDDAEPSPGAVTVCMKCNEVLLFDEDLQLKRPTPAELLKLQLDLSWVKVEKLRASIRKMHGAIARGELPPLEGDAHE